MKVAIIGGGGYIGFHIAKALKLLGHDVALLDLQFPSDEWLCSSHLPEAFLMKGLTSDLNSKDSPNQLQSFVSPGDLDGTYEIIVYNEKTDESTSFAFFKVDIANKESLVFYFKELGAVECVIHTASYGMSGASQLPRFTTKMELVNIQGLRNVIECSADIGVKAFVYTSTYNVVFGGHRIENGDESLPYFPLVNHVDSYSRTKSIGEQILLTADGKNGMRTCALRLAGVMGPMEQRHIPRVVTNLDRGLVVVNYHDQSGSVVDFVGIQNVVQAHVKAALRLLAAGPTLGGNAYFISDGMPVNNMEYFRPLIESRGRRFPSLFIPLWVMIIVIYAVEYLANLFCFAPILTRAEIYKTGVTHNFSVAKARKDLDYNPTDPNDISLIVNYYKQTEGVKKKGL